MHFRALPRDAPQGRVLSFLHLFTPVPAVASAVSALQQLLDPSAVEGLVRGPSPDMKLKVLHRGLRSTQQQMPPTNVTHLQPRCAGTTPSQNENSGRLSLIQGWCSFHRWFGTTTLLVLAGSCCLLGGAIWMARLRAGTCLTMLNVFDACMFVVPLVEPVSFLIVSLVDARLSHFTPR